MTPPDGEIRKALPNDLNSTATTSNSEQSIAKRILELLQVYSSTPGSGNSSGSGSISLTA